MPARKDSLSRERRPPKGGDGVYFDTPTSAPRACSYDLTVRDAVSLQDLAVHCSTIEHPTWDPPA